MRYAIFPLGLSLRPPNDSLGHRVASLLIRPGDARDRLTAGIYISDDPADVTGCLEDALQKVIRAEPIERRLRREEAVRDGLENYSDWVESLRAAGQISADEAGVLLEACSATRRVIRVDDFSPAQLTGKVDSARASTAGKKAEKKKTAVKKKRAG